MAIFNSKLLVICDFASTVNGLKKWPLLVNPTNPGTWCGVENRTFHFFGMR